MTANRNSGKIQVTLDTSLVLSLEVTLLADLFQKYLMGIGLMSTGQDREDRRVCLKGSAHFTTYFLPIWD